jgi:ADP-dependent NAD(P)H-hydrate dehydratase
MPPSRRSSPPREPAPEPVRRARKPRVTDSRMVTPDLLCGWPLPQPSEEGDKEERGRVLVVGGSAEMPGAVILAATAALRAGAGKLQVATGGSIAQLVAAAVPEARVIALPETDDGAIDPEAAARIGELAERAQAVLLGPGMIDEEAVGRLVQGVLPRVSRAVVVLDAAAMVGCMAKEPHCLHPLKGGAVLTPHAGEMASCLGMEKDAVLDARLATARKAAATFRAVVALKGSETIIAAPDGPAYCNQTGNVGLATSGSGDTLAGIVAGLAARGAEPLQAAVWGVYLHGSAGDRLARRLGRLGFLARELLAEVPLLMAEFDGSRPRRRRGPAPEE